MTEFLYTRTKKKKGVFPLRGKLLYRRHILRFVIMVLIVAIILLFAPIRVTAAGESPAFRVAIDSGHGGDDPGALDVSGAIYESNINQQVTDELTTLFQRDGRVEVVLTHEAGENPDINARAAKASEVSADLFLSLHLNSGGDNHDVRGFQIFPHNPGDELHAQSLRAGRMISGRMREVGGVPYDHDGIYYLAFHSGEEKEFFAAAEHPEGLPFNGPTFGVVQYAGTPALLIELWFITNLYDMARFNNHDGVRNMAWAVYQGTMDYLLGESTLEGNIPLPSKQSHSQQLQSPAIQGIEWRLR